MEDGVSTIETSNVNLTWLRSITLFLRSLAKLAISSFPPEREGSDLRLVSSMNEESGNRTLPSNQDLVSLGTMLCFTVALRWPCIGCDGIFPPYPYLINVVCTNRFC